MENNLIQIITTAGSQENAREISQYLLTNRLVACAQVHGPIESSYWWEGKITQDTEWVCTFKSSYKLLEKVKSGIKEKHSYEVPEIIAFKSIDTDLSYLQWLNEICQ